MRDISFTLRSLLPLAAVLILASSLALHSAEEVRRAQAVTPAAKPATPPPKAVAVASTNSPVAPSPAAGPNTFAAAKPAEAKPADAKPATVSTSTNTPTGTAGKTVDLTPEQKKKIEEYMARAKTSNEALAKQRKLLDRNMPNADQVNPTITERTSIPSRF